MIYVLKALRTAVVCVSGEVRTLWRGHLTLNVKVFNVLLRDVVTVGGLSNQEQALTRELVLGMRAISQQAE